MDNIWLLTEERPKPSVIQQIIDAYCADFGDHCTPNGDIKIRPHIENGVFAFVYEVEGITLSNAQNIYLKTVSGYSSFLDFTLYKQVEAPVENDNSQIPLMGIEETKTNDDESRNTGVNQRISKFVFFRHYYPNTQLYMLYNEELEAREDKKPSDTNIFGTNILLTLNIKVIGKDMSTWFHAFTSLDEMIAFKQRMSPPHPGNVPIQINRSGNIITVSGRLSKPATAGNIAYDPNIGTLSMIGAGLRKLGWQGDIVLTQHHVSQRYVSSNPYNKLLYNCKILDMKLDGLTLPTITLPQYYWHYEKSSEKLASILLHVQCMYRGIKCIYENHAGCERGYFVKQDGGLTALPKAIQNGKIPDVILYDEATRFIVLVEGKKLSTLSDGLREIRLFDRIEQDHIYPEYGNVTILRCLTIFGGEEQALPDRDVLFYLTDSGRIIINSNAPTCIVNSFSGTGVSYM